MHNPSDERRPVVRRLRVVIHVHLARRGLALAVARRGQLDLPAIILRAGDVRDADPHVQREARDGTALVVDVGTERADAIGGATETNLLLAAPMPGESQAALAKMASDIRARVRSQTGHDAPDG